MKRAVYLLAVVAIGAVGYRYFNPGASEFVPEIRTVTVTVGDVADTVGATGALEAVTTVQVGSQVSGIIQDLFVDYNSIVHEGDVIMRLDPSLFETQTAQARANLIRAEADVERSDVDVDDARMQLTRAEDLAARDLISATELEAAQVRVRSAAAQVKSAAAQVIQAQAALNQNEVNLEHTVIRSPIDGIVISRLVDVGQTVAASLQAPELFVIAADLTKMRVIANIDESDVGRIRPNQRVTFTVDAYPEEEFEGVVSQIRLEPVVQQNVVTYATVVDAPNPDLKLKPGMTATITLEVARSNDIVRIPNAALRFRPTSETFAALGQPVSGRLDETFAVQGDRSRPAGTTAAVDHGEGGPTFGGSPFGDGRPGGGNPQTRRTANATDAPAVPAVERGATTIDALFGPLQHTTSTGRVWVMEDEQLAPITVTLGVTNGTTSELLSADGSHTPLTDGTPLVSFVSIPDDGPAARDTGGSPLIPRFGRRRR